MGKQVQLIATPADVNAAGQQQQPILNMAAGNKQHSSKHAGFFRSKKAASKQVVPAGGGGVSPQSVLEAEPSDLIPAVTQPSGMVEIMTHLQPPPWLLPSLLTR